MEPLTIERKKYDEVDHVSISYIGMEQQHLVAVIIIAHGYSIVNRIFSKEMPK